MGEASLAYFMATIELVLLNVVISALGLWPQSYAIISAFWKGRRGTAWQDSEANGKSCTHKSMLSLLRIQPVSSEK